ncbi:MAG: SAM-dependent methyltransferase [Desulfuromonadaceae bacterium]
MIDQMPAEQRPELEAFIRQRIVDQGGIPFVEYMEHCLYHPQYGYYMAPRERIGKKGDFFTSTSVHSAFGRLLCRQLEQMWQILAQGSFTIAEQGAGEGHLCLDILDAAAEEYPEFYRSLQYRLVDISPDNQQRQKALLQDHLERIEWCSLAELKGMEGCFLSNELVDAFPVHQVVMQDGQLQEVYVVAGEEGFVEELRPPSTERLPEHLAGLGVSLVEGARAEVNLAAVKWMTQLATLVQRGFILTIDYGYPAAELYAPWRNRGTLMCYYRHTSNENPYLSPGCQDITAHIDFTTLERVGESLGVKRIFYGDQCRFLLGLGFVDLLMEMQARTTNENEARALRLTLKNLIMPDGGMGDTFKVLIQAKAVEPPLLLCQRSLSDLPLPPMV